MDENKESSDQEDIPSDFFDDFTKDDFMAGLSVVDSWNDNDMKNKEVRERRIQAKDVDRVNDLRELIDKDDKELPRHNEKLCHRPSSSNVNEERKARDQEEMRLDDYIKPGSRRDPNKTKKAIKRDKEVKVKEYLTKHLEDDLRPPGTELDDYFDGNNTPELKTKTNHHVKQNKGLEPEPYVHTKSNQTDKKYRRALSPKHRRASPTKWHRESPRQQGSPRRQAYLRRHVSPLRYRRYSPVQYSHHSPHRSSRWSPQYRSPVRKVKRYSPSLHRLHRSRSPYQRSYKQSRSRSRSRSHSRSGKHIQDDFLYPNNYVTPAPHSSYNMDPQYSQVPQYVMMYPQGPSYPTYTPNPETLPMPASIDNSTPITRPQISVPIPSQPPQPLISPSINPQPSQTMESTATTPYDALAKLVADGKLSHEDYLKLAPHGKSTVPFGVDTKERVSVLNRCMVAMSRLGNMVLPNHLQVNNIFVGQEQKSIAPKFSSPLRRQTAMEFNFSKMSKSSINQRNKQILDTIITTLSLDKVVGRPKKKVQKDTKDAAVQTTIPVCDVCEIREYAKFCDVSTSVDPEYFSSSVHTQVLDKDLYNSKAMFTPSGSSSGGAHISIAHLTPAQLVSQLAAKAKTLKQTDNTPSPNIRNNQPNYDYEYSYNRRSGNQYSNPNYNYRY